MPDIASVTLTTLRCLKESDRGGKSHSEPYIWPFMASVANKPLSFATTPTVARLSDSRDVIKEEMKAGQSATLDGPNNVIATTFEDGQEDRTLILIVTLLEEDDLPRSAVQAGYQAYLDELKKRVGLNILALKQAVEANDADALKEIIDEIKITVTAKVKAAITDHLSTWEKVQVKLGSLNPDDVMATAFALLPGDRASDFTLDFLGTAGDKKGVIVPGGGVGPGGGFPLKFVDVAIHFTLEGRVAVSEVTSNPCQGQIDAVNAAEQAVKGLQQMVQSLQKQLATATPQQKPGIISLIRQINEQQLPAARKNVAIAQQALRFCEILQAGQALF